MKERAFVKWFGVPLVLNAITLSCLGCSQSDLKGYNRVPIQTSKPDTQHPIDEELVANASTSPATDAVAEETDHTEDQLATKAGIPISASVSVNKVDGSNIQRVSHLPSTSSKTTGEELSSNTDSKPAVAAPPAEARKIELLVKHKSFPTDSRTGSFRVSFDDLDLLKVLNMEPVEPDADEMMPDWLRGLDGKKVRIRGYMYPTYDAEGIERFVLARDNQECCFGPNPKIYNLIRIEMKAGTSTNYIPLLRAFDVVGNFHIQMESVDGKPLGLYVIDQATVIDR